MKVLLSEISPSPFNPKRPLSKKEYTALLRGVKKFGFARGLVVCKDFISGQGYICLDGHTALDLLKDLGKSKVDVFVVDNVTDEKSLKEFIASYSIRKEPLYYEFYKEFGDELEEIIGKSITTIESVIQEQERQKQDFLENEYITYSYILTLRAETCKRIKNRLKKNKQVEKDERLLAEIDKIDDTRLLESLAEIIYGVE